VVIEGDAENEDMKKEEEGMIEKEPTLS